MRVKAIAVGYDGISLRQVGEVFDIPDSYKDKDGVLRTHFDKTWMERTEEEGSVSVVPGTPGKPWYQEPPKNKGGRPRKIV